MDLLCTERVADGHLIATNDWAISRDPRVIENLLQIELTQTPSIINYFNNFQTDLRPPMRKMVASWMLEVCEEQRCEPQVFPLAVTLLDQFLSICRIRQHQMQLLAAVCLLIASKCRQCRPLGIDLLCFYTENSITSKLMKDWELLVLSKLQWNVNPVTGFDFVDQMIVRCEPIRLHTLVRRHAHTLLALAYTELKFLGMTPSMIATACLIAASQGLRVAWDSYASIGELIPGLDRTNVELTIYNLEEALMSQVYHQTTTTRQDTTTTTTSPSSTTTSNKLNSSLGNTSTSEDESSQPGTPKDVQDIDF